jgi:hypothetical protein
MTIGAGLLILFLVCFLMTWLALFVFSIISPAGWSRKVDRIHQYFLQRRIISNRVSEQMKILEKGFVLRLILAATILIATLDLSVCVMRFALGIRI